MTEAQTIWAFTLTFALYAGWMDWRTRRIPNWLTMTGLCVGIAANAVLAGWHGTARALEGAGLAMVLLLPFVLLRALGAGDWKLMAAVGAFLGPKLFLAVLVVSIFVAGAMGMLQMMRAHRVIGTLKNMWVLVQGFLTFGLRANPEISLDNPGLLKLPFGVAVAIAAVICFVAGHLGY
ncbi:MAG: A24 family peptidase [Candidatus Acidiferrales bacterium]